MIKNNFFKMMLFLFSLEILPSTVNSSYLDKLPPELHEHIGKYFVTGSNFFKQKESKFSESNAIIYWPSADRQENETKQIDFYCDFCNKKLIDMQKNALISLDYYLYDNCSNCRYNYFFVATSRETLMNKTNLSKYTTKFLAISTKITSFALTKSNNSPDKQFLAINRQVDTMDNAKNPYIIDLYEIDSIPYDQTINAQSSSNENFLGYTLYKNIVHKKTVKKIIFTEPKTLLILSKKGTLYKLNPFVDHTVNKTHKVNFVIKNIPILTNIETIAVHPYYCNIIVIVEAHTILCSKVRGIWIADIDNRSIAPLFQEEKKIKKIIIDRNKIQYHFHEKFLQTYPLYKHYWRGFNIPYFIIDKYSKRITTNDKSNNWTIFTDKGSHPGKKKFHKTTINKRKKKIQNINKKISKKTLKFKKSIQRYVTWFAKETSPLSAHEHAAIYKKIYEAVLLYKITQKQEKLNKVRNTLEEKRDRFENEIYQLKQNGKYKAERKQKPYNLNFVSFLCSLKQKNPDAPAPTEEKEMDESKDSSTFDHALISGHLHWISKLQPLSYITLSPWRIIQKTFIPIEEKEAD